MSEARNELVDELQAMLIKAMETSDDALVAADKRREIELETARLNLLTERLVREQEFGQHMEDLNGRVIGFQDSLKRLPPSLVTPSPSR